MVLASRAVSSTLTRGGRRRDVRCPNCGGVREVSYEHSLRIEKGVNSATCGTCQKPPTIRITERLRRELLIDAGVPEAMLLGPQGSHAYVRQHGLPPTLQAIVASGAFA